MESNIGVGVIVGLALASSIYVWNNDKFSSVQKTILLVCIIFPPAQWLGILIVSIYNSNIENKTPKRKAEKKLDSTILNLTELKDKGILTEEEYNTKVAKINVEKEEQSLKNSLEYKQLKGLFDNGILTKGEFENKIKLIQNVSEKEVDIEEINNVINSVNTTYLDNVEEKQQDKKGSSTPIYVLSILFFVILLGSVIIYSDNNNNETNVDSNYVEPMIVDTLNTNVNKYQEPLTIKKYVYIVFKVKTPKVHESKTDDRFNSLTNSYIPSKYLYSTTWEEISFLTDILEIEDYNEDNKNRVLDEKELEINKKLESYDAQYLIQTNICVDKYKREELQKEKSMITERNIFDFDTYSEASVSKRNN